jgi:hypothetical protein
MTKSSVALLILSLAMFLSCEEPTQKMASRGESVLTFRVAFEELGDCREPCKEFHTVTEFGEPRSLYAPQSPAFSVPADALLAARTWTNSGLPPTLTLLLEKRAARDLSEWAQENAAKIGNVVLVTLDDSAISSVRGPVLRNMGGILVLSLTKETLAAVQSMMDVKPMPESVATSHDGAICDVLAEGDARLLERCRDLLAQDLDEQSEVLDRVEEQLDSENPDYDAILRDLGVE